MFETLVRKKQLLKMKIILFILLSIFIILVSSKADPQFDECDPNNSVAKVTKKKSLILYF